MAEHKLIENMDDLYENIFTLRKYRQIHEFYKDLIEHGKVFIVDAKGFYPAKFIGLSENNFGKYPKGESEKQYGIAARDFLKELLQQKPLKKGEDGWEECEKRFKEYCEEKGFKIYDNNRKYWI